MRDQVEYDRKLNEMKEIKKSGWFTSKEKKAQNEKELQEFAVKLQEELENKQQVIGGVWEKEMEELQEEMRKQNTGTTDSDFTKMPAHYIRFKFKVEIPSLKLAFINEFG